MPSMGFCLLVSYGWHCLMDNHKRFSKRTASVAFKLMALVSMALLCGLYGVKTLTRNRDWRDEYSLFSAGLRFSQNNAKLFNNVGHALESRGEHAQALKFFQHAANNVQPDDVGAHINVGRTFNNLKMFKEAEESYLKAKSLLPKSRPGETYQARVAPSHLNVFVNLASLISKNGSRLEEADHLYRQAISMRADYTQAYINRGDILIKLNRTKEAQQVYEQALAYDQDNPDLLYNMGVVLLNQGYQSKALSYLEQALKYDPNHYQALLNSAILIQESGRNELNHLATERLMKILEQESSDVNERVYFNLGMLAMDKRDRKTAEKWFRKAVDAKPDFRSALFNLALLLSEGDFTMDSVPVLQQLLRFYPDHVKGLILMGDIYVNQMRDLPAAELCYKKILQVEPNNVQARHNMCVVMVEAGHLERARECLLKVSKLAPSELYISKHLKIVEDRLDMLSQQHREENN